jgi:peptidoglycan/xylan/chitin deacetylase (PgdA/CDA1 family)
MQSLALPSWPDGAEVAVSLTFDVDAETSWLSKSAAYERRLTTLSESRYGVGRGLSRVFELLRECSLPATFYIPGATVERHPDAVLRVLEAGHDLGHHGHDHLRSHLLDADEQRVEIVRGLAAIEQVAGIVPRGYRSPAWEVTPETLALLDEFGFAHDSSFMEEDRPYALPAGTRPLIELPVHWSLDDWAYFGWDADEGGRMTAPSAFVESWLAEFRSAARERRHVTLTMHPEIIGRGYRVDAVRELIERMSAHTSVWFATHGQVADRVIEANRQALSSAPADA